MAPLTLALLGPLLVLRDGRPLAGFESAKVRALLAYLAAEADHPHQRDALAGLFWPEQPDQAARNNLRQALANLRQVIGDRTAAEPALLIAREQIQFNPASDHSLDLADFLGLLAACEAHPHRRPESCASCAERRARAVALYRGPLLEGFFLGDSEAFEEWMALKREDLHQRALAALALLASFHERRGGYERAWAYAQRQIELAPWREEAHRQLMRVLLRRGERSAALAQYELCRRILADQLGAEPDAATTSLYEQIRAGELCAAPGAPAQPGVALPPQPTAFVGREAELADLADMLENPACRLVTIVGPGGVGKTRLALQVAAGQAHAFAEGVVFVALAALSSAEFLAATLADALQITVGPQSDPRAQLIAALRPRELLLILDNFEQLLPGATLLAEILREAPAVTLLVTSRERLDLRWEWVFDLGGLSYPQGAGAYEPQAYSAVQLFVQRARQLRLRFSLAGAAGAAVAEICRLVEGNPLGVELAASSVREHAPEAIAGRIRDALTQLATSSRDVAPRHRSMRAAFDHSWELLSAEERRGFRRLSVFRGGFGEAAAEAVAGATPELLAALANKSLLRWQAPGRHDMHEIARQYAQWQLEAAQEQGPTRARHLEQSLALAEAAEPELLGPEQQRWLARLDLELDNLREALAWALTRPQPDAAMRMAGALMRFWAIRGHFDEGRRWTGRILTHPGAASASAPLRLKALSADGMLARLQGDYARAHASLQACLELGRASGEARWVAVALNGLGLVARRQGDPTRAAALYEESLALSRQAGDRRDIVNALANLAGVVNAQGDHRRAAALYEESLAFSRETGDRLGIAADLNNLANVIFDLGDYERARALYEESDALYREGGDQHGRTLTLYNLGDLALRTGGHERARACLAEGLALTAALGDRPRCAEYLERLAALAAGTGEPGRAARLWGAAEALREELGAAREPHALEAHEAEVGAARRQLDAAAFAAAWAGGRALKLQQALAEALGQG